MYAVIVADPNSTALGEILSTHRTVAGAWKALRKLGNQRWTYVAERRPDGSYPHRVEALGLPAHAQGYEDQIEREHRAA